MVSDGRGPSRWSMRERRVAWQPSHPRPFCAPPAASPVDFVVSTSNDATRRVQTIGRGRVESRVKGERGREGERERGRAE